MSKAFSTRFACSLLPYVLIGYLYCYIVILQESMNRMSLLIPQLATDGNLNSFRIRGDKIGSRSSSSSNNRITSLSISEKVNTLEMKLHAYLGYDSDPFYWTQTPAKCHNFSDLQEFCPIDDCDAIPMCQDNFPYNDCIVYDFGIRTQPHFGVIFSKPPFNCHVFAFDPSPITKTWYETNSELKNNPNYHMYYYGGGGADENITLREYNWNQVSIYSYPSMVVANPKNCTGGDCRFKYFPSQRTFQVPVRSVGSLMEELGHDRVDILKLDVEGSEYRMLEGILEHGTTCQRINQIALEWHHYDYDVRYGVASVPHLNLYVKLLKEKCGLEQFWIHHPEGGWPSNSELYIDMQIRLMYNLASFMRVKATNE